MDKWQSEFDREMARLMNDGAFDNLPGTGKPLNLADESHVPEELRMAHRILSQNDMAPEWILMAKDIEQSANNLRQSITNHLRQYRDGLARAGTPQLRQNIEQVWMNAKRQLEGQTKAHNNMVLNFNLKVPAGVPHQLMFDLEREIAKLKS